MEGQRGLRALRAAQEVGQRGADDHRVRPAQAVVARPGVERAGQPQHAARRRGARQPRVVGRAGRRLGADQQRLTQAAAVLGVVVVAGPLVDHAGLVGHVEVAALGADLDRVAVAAGGRVRVVLGRAGRVVELEAVLRRVAGGVGHRVADLLHALLVGRLAAVVQPRRAQDERGDVVQRDEVGHLVGADVVPHRLHLGLRARPGAVVRLGRRVLAGAVAAPEIAVVAVGVDAPLQLARQVAAGVLAVAVLAPVGEQAAGRGDRLDEGRVRVLAGELVARVERAARRDEAVGIDQRDDDDALGVEDVLDARIAARLGEQVGELHRRLGRRPLARVVQRHEEEDRPSVGAADVVGDLDALDLAALERLADHQRPHRVRMVGCGLLELVLDLGVGAVRRAARRERRGAVHPRGIARVGAPGGGVGVLEVGDAHVVAQAQPAQRVELRGPVDDHVDPVRAPVLGHVEAGELVEPLDLARVAVDAHELGRGAGLRRGDVGEREAHGRPGGAPGAPAALRDQAVAGAHPGSGDLARAKALGRGDAPARGAVAQQQVPVARRGPQAGGDVAGHGRGVDRRGEPAAGLGRVVAGPRDGGGRRQRAGDGREDRRRSGRGR